MDPQMPFHARAVRSVRIRMEPRRNALDLSPRMRRDIGLDPVPEDPRFPPYAALITRV